MLKSTVIRAFFFFLISTGQYVDAKTGPLFDVVAAGTPSQISITLCLNGRAAISCQDYTISALDLTISPTIPNRLYPSIGVRINTPGYTFSNQGLDCTQIVNDFCLFQASQAQPKTLSLTGASPVTQLSQMVAVGSSSVPISYTSSDGGVTWITSSMQPQGAAYLLGVACNSSGSVCTAVGYDNSSFPRTYSTTDGGDNWTLSTQQPQPVNNSGYLYAVACTSNGSRCTAVGSDDNGDLLSYISDNGGLTWATSATLPTLSGNDAGFLRGVACMRNSSRCTAVGSNYTTGQSISYITDDAGDHWRVSNTQPSYSNDFVLRSVACTSSSSRCTAVGYYNFTNNKPISYVSYDGGDNWVYSSTQPPYISDGRLSAVACAGSGSSCTAVGYSGNEPVSYTTNDGGVTWAASITQPPLNNSNNSRLAGVVCSSSGSTCSAVGTDGDSRPLAYTTIDAGVNWNLSTTQPPITGTGSLSGVG